MKMLKRAGAIAIAGAMALSLGSVAYAADPTITVGDINISPAEDGIVTVTVPYTAENLATGAQVTLLAELGAAEKVYASNIVYDTTAYIDQDAAGSEFTFKINKSRLVGNEKADVWLNVKVGGTGVATAAEGSVLAYDYVEAPKTPITSAEVVAAADATIGANAYGSGKSLVRLDVTELVANQKLDLTSQKVLINGYEAQYTQYTVNGADVIKLVAVADATDASAITVTVENGASTRMYYGDVTNDTVADLDDIVQISKVVVNATQFTTTQMISADVTAEGAYDLDDIVQISKKVVNDAVIFPVIEK